jgi:hypothetical protein
MKHRFLTLLTLGAFVAGMAMVAAPGTAIAADPPPAVPATDPAVPVINPTSGPPGTVIAVTVPGCTGTVSAALGSQEGDVLAINEGPAPTVNLTVPAGTPQGEILVVAGCNVYSENDFNFTTFTVSAAAVVSQPSFTG